MGNCAVARRRPLKDSDSALADHCGASRRRRCDSVIAALVVARARDPAPLGLRDAKRVIARLPPPSKAKRITAAAYLHYRSAALLLYCIQWPQLLESNITLALCTHGRALCHESLRLAASSERQCST